MTKQLLTLEEIARILKVKYPRAAELARDGIIPVVRLGRQVRVDPDQLTEFISGGGRALPGGWRREVK
jgi:excisionase family DNA binding protein